MGANIKLRPHEYFEIPSKVITEQKTADSFYDPQVRLLFSTLKHIVKEHECNIVFDYGCGSRGNLFYDLASRSDLVGDFRILYFGYDLADYDIDEGEYSKYVTLFANDSKKFGDVFLKKDTLHRFKNTVLKESVYIVVLKNVIHELPLYCFYDCFALINDLLSTNGHLIIIDQIRLKYHEPEGVAWHYDDVEEFVSNWLGYTSLARHRSVDMILEEYEGKERQTPFYLLCFQKTEKSLMDAFKESLHIFTMNSQKKRIDYISYHLMSKDKTTQLQSMINSHELTQIQKQLSIMESGNVKNIGINSPTSEPNEFVITANLEPGS
jgi:hypothetical protein